MDTKTCTQCNRAVPLDGFYKWGGKRAGRMAECKECFKARVSRRWPSRKPRAVGLRRNARHAAKERGDDSYYRELLANCNGNGRTYMPVDLITDDMILLKRLEVALRRYAKENR